MPKFLISKRPAHFRAFLAALLFTFIFGALEAGEPLEDLLRGLRNTIQPRPADGKVVVVGLDDATFDKLGMNYSERYDAEAIDALIAAGARRVYYDRTFQDISNPENARILIRSLKRNQGKVFFGAISETDKRSGITKFTGPAAPYIPYVQVASLRGKSTPFGLSAELSLADKFVGRAIPSVSASIAKRTEEAGAMYRPDWTIRASSIPKISFLDVIGKSSKLNLVRGKDVIIGPDALRVPDHAHIIGQGWVPGVYFHVIGAQTLSEGTPRTASWLLPFAAAALLAWALLRARSREFGRRIDLIAAALAMIVPFITDRLLITTDYLPAILLYSVVAYRAHRTKAISTASQHNPESGMPNLAAFRDDGIAPDSVIAALLIKNYERILTAYPEIGVEQLVESFSRPIAVTIGKDAIYHDDNTLYWVLPKMAPEALAAHIDGLRALITTIRTPSATVDLDYAIGIDTQFPQALDRRIKEAKIAAGYAAEHGLNYSIAVRDSDDEKQWRLSLMNELEHALESGQISVVYQPQVSLTSNRLVGAEALVRWNHPTRGPISPAQFVAQAEATSRIAKLTDYVLDVVLRDLGRILAQDPDFAVGVNLSAKLFRDANLAPHLIDRVGRQGVPLGALKLEVTETATLENTQQALLTLHELARNGCSISIDDYGTGNATLEYLRSIPFNELKIDREFIADLVSSDRDKLLVKSTISLAHALGHTVTAEGVEDAQTLALLKMYHCDRAQSFYISRPVAIDELLSQLLEDHSRKQGVLH